MGDNLHSQASSLLNGLRDEIVQFAAIMSARDQILRRVGVRYM